MADLATHLQLALSRHIRQLHRDGRPVPVELLAMERQSSVLAALVSGLAANMAANGRERDATGAGADDGRVVTFSHEEAARVLGVSRRTIRRWRADGRLRATGRRLWATDVRRLADGGGR